MFELPGFFEVTVAVLKKYQTWALLILATDAYCTMTSVLIHDVPAKTIFQFVWLLVFGTALIITIVSNEVADTASRLGLVERGRSPRQPLRSVTRLS